MRSPLRNPNNGADRSTVCRHAYRRFKEGSAVVVLRCDSCGATTLEFRAANGWTRRDRRFVDRYYIRGDL